MTTGLKRQTKSQLINIILRKDNRETILAEEVKQLKCQNDELIKMINDLTNNTLFIFI